MHNLWKYKLMNYTEFINHACIPLEFSRYLPKKLRQEPHISSASHILSVFSIVNFSLFFYSLLRIGEIAQWLREMVAHTQDHIRQLTTACNSSSRGYSISSNVREHLAHMHILILRHAGQ